VLSIGHRPDLAAYHTRSLQLVYGRDGARLKLKQPVPRPRRPRRWLKRFRRPGVKP
jgi:putative ATP-binding cassette transporter